MSSLERAASGSSRCKLCKQLIAKSSLRVGIRGDSRSYDGTMTLWQHVLCAVLSNPAGFLRASRASPEVPKATREPFELIANTIRARKLKGIVWRHASEARCLIELSDGGYALLIGDLPLVVKGPLDEVVASVPDQDLQAVVDAAVAAGKKLGRT